jgi:hypothetical protein
MQPADRIHVVSTGKSRQPSASFAVCPAGSVIDPPPGRVPCAETNDPATVKAPHGDSEAATERRRRIEVRLEGEPAVGAAENALTSTEIAGLPTQVQLDPLGPPSMSVRPRSRLVTA